MKNKQKKRMNFLIDKKHAYKNRTENDEGWKLKSRIFNRVKEKKNYVKDDAFENPCATDIHCYPFIKTTSRPVAT